MLVTVSGGRLVNRRVDDALFNAIAICAARRTARNGVHGWIIDAVGFTSFTTVMDSDPGHRILWEPCQIRLYFYLRQMNEVNGGDNVFVR